MIVRTEFEGPLIIATRTDEKNPAIQLISPDDAESPLDAFKAFPLGPGLWEARYVSSDGFAYLGCRIIQC